MLVDKKAVNPESAAFMAIMFAIRRLQMDGKLPFDLRNPPTPEQRAILRETIRSISPEDYPIDLSKLSSDELADLETTVKRFGKPKDRDHILARLRYEREVAEGISNPTVIKAKVEKGEVGLIHPENGKWISLHDAKEAYRKRETNPAAWCAVEARLKVIAGQNRLFDLRGLTAAQQGELMTDLQEIGPALGGLSNCFDTGLPGSDERRKARRDVRRISIRADADSLKKKRGYGKLALDILGENWKAKDDFSGRIVEFRIGHRDKAADIFDRLIEEAKAGKLKGKVIVQLICADFTKPKVLAKLMELRDAVLTGKNGEDAAAGLLMPSKDVHVPAMTLAALALKNDPYLLGSGGTARQLVQRVFLHTAEMLAAAKNADDPLKRINEIFNTDKVADFFKKGDGKPNRELIDETIERLRTDWYLFHDFTMKNQRAKKHLC